MGLLSLMAQAGLPVPAAEAEFPLFEQVLADIGDYQSIQENLSTFSAHVSNIREMALDVTPDSLVLLDELGSATDPEEGGALGVAIVEHFRAAGAFTLVSTHLMALKIYGASTEGVVNGSMGFDEADLRADVSPAAGPARQIGRAGDRHAPGHAGGHHASRARRSMSDRERDVTRFLGELHRRIEETAGAGSGAAREDCADSERREKELAREWEKRETAKLKELERRTDLALARFEEQAQETHRQDRPGRRPAQGRAGSAAPHLQGQTRTARGFPDHRAGHRRTIRGRTASSRCASKKACACACATCATRRACAASWATAASKWKPAS